MAHLALMWADGNAEILKQFKLLFYIKLSEVTGEDKTLEEIITEQHKELNGMEDLLHVQLQDPDGRVLLILDGLDEYKMGTNTVIDNIVNNASSATMGMLVIITSRSEAESLHRIAKQMNKIIIAKGFSTESIHRCAANFFRSGGNEKEAPVFIKNDISELFRIPIILVMAYLLHKENKNQSPPTSKTEVVGDIIDFIIDRKKSTPLTEEEKTRLKIQVGEKAWIATQKDTMVLLKVYIKFQEYTEIYAPYLHRPLL